MNQKFRLEVQKLLNQVEKAQGDLGYCEEVLELIQDEELEFKEGNISSADLEVSEVTLECYNNAFRYFRKAQGDLGYCEEVLELIQDKELEFKEGNISSADLEVSEVALECYNNAFRYFRKAQKEILGAIKELNQAIS